MEDVKKNEAIFESLQLFPAVSITYKDAEPYQFNLNRLNLNIKFGENFKTIHVIDQSGVCSQITYDDELIIFKQDNGIILLSFIKELNKTVSFVIDEVDEYDDYTIEHCQILTSFLLSSEYWDNVYAMAQKENKLSIVSMKKRII